MERLEGMISVKVTTGSVGITNAYFGILERTLAALRDRGDGWVKFEKFGRRRELPDDQARYLLAILVAHGYVEADGSVDNAETMYRLTDKGRDVLPPKEVREHVCRGCYASFKTKRGLRWHEKTCEVMLGRRAASPERRGAFRSGKKGAVDEPLFDPIPGMNASPATMSEAFREARGKTSLGRYMREETPDPGRARKRG